MRNEPEEILNVVGSDTVIEANDSAHSPIERCQVVNAEETVTRASELNNREAELRVDTKTAGDDAIKDDILQDALVSSNDKLHIEQVCKAHKGAKRYSCPGPTVSALRGRSSAPAVPTPFDAVASIFYSGAF